MSVYYNQVENLHNIGPIIEVIVYPPQPVFQDLKSKNLNIPYAKIIGLIATGASHSCIDYNVAEQVELIPRDILEVATPSGLSKHPVFDAGFSLPNSRKSIIPIHVFGSNLTTQLYQALIGRDILRFCTFIYNGWNNSYQLHITNI